MADKVGHCVGPRFFLASECQEQKQFSFKKLESISFRQYNLVYAFNYEESATIWFILITDKYI